MSDKLDPAQIKGVFAFYDKDSDGKIDTSELGSCMRSLGQTPTDKELVDIATQIDQGGKFDVDGFTKVVTARKDLDVAGPILEAFKLFDKDGDGKVATSELLHVMTNLGEKIDDDDADDLVEEAKEENGRINYEKFVEMITK